MIKQKRKFEHRYPEFVNDASEARVIKSNSKCRYGIPPCGLLVTETPGPSQIIQVLATALGRSIGLDGKTLLLKTQHTVVAGHREEIKLELT